VGLPSRLEEELADLDMARTAVRWARWWWCFPSALHYPDRWVVWWGEWQLRATSYRVPLAPTTLYSAGDRGPPTSERLGAPDQGADEVKGSCQSRWALVRWRSILTFSPLISTFLLTLYFHFIRFILDQSIGHVSSSQLYCR
jgi:hypothetical protein